jgi:hypothetical protein
MPPNMPPYFFVFDVESVGLQGVGFAAGWVVIDPSGKEHGSGLFACHLAAAVEVVDGEDVLWCQQHVIPALAATMDKLISVPDPKALRISFWSHWQQWKQRGAVMVADCPWPVEARFLHACIDTRFGNRRMAGDFDGPYPLIDVASVRMAKGLDPLEAGERLPGELPAHNPMMDARQSARLLIEALNL